LQRDAESSEKLDSIAELAGFSDASNFSRAFTEIAGIRPRSISTTRV